AMAQLSDVPLRLMVATADSPKPFLDLAQQLGVASSCTWEVSTPEILDLYAAADLYVSPSFEDSFGLPVAEAMACGLPAITSAFAGVSELIRNGLDGFVLDRPADPDALSHLVRALAADPGTRRRTGEAAAQTAAQWTWDRSAAAAHHLIEASVARKLALSKSPAAR